MTLARFQMCIGGEWVDALSGKTFESLNPALAEPWAELPDADEADVERAVQAAQTAFDSPAWRGLTATARGKLLRRLGDLIAENKEQLAQLESRDNGKLIRETRGQVGYLPEFSTTPRAWPTSLKAAPCRWTSPTCSPTPCTKPWAWSPRSFRGTARCT